MNDVPVKIRKRNQWNVKEDNEYFTPDEVWNLILPYIPKSNTIYDPFYGDGRSGDYIRSQGYTVIHENEDCYDNYAKYDFDLILSNPPFSTKKQVFQWLFALNKPFIMLVPLATLSTNYVAEYLTKLKIIIPRRRIHFYKELNEDGSEKILKRTSFDTVFLCYKCHFIPHSISRVGTP